MMLKVRGVVAVFSFFFFVYFSSSMLSLCFSFHCPSQALCVCEKSDVSIYIYFVWYEYGGMCLADIEYSIHPNT